MYSKFRLEIGDVEVVYGVEPSASASSARTTCRYGSAGDSYSASSENYSTAHDGISVKLLSLGDTNSRGGVEHEHAGSGDGSGDDGNASDSSDASKPGTRVGSWLDNISNGSDDAGTRVGDINSSGGAAPLVLL